MPPKYAGGGANGQPTIFKATYSGVEVYEFSIKGVAVMKRKGDGYMNATQILKVADFDKPQRTRILEREVQKGDHEKVQGGYGKYQGTWIPYDRSVDLARQYQVDTILAPIIEFSPSATSPPPVPKVTAQRASAAAVAAARQPPAPRVKAPRKAVPSAAAVAAAAAANAPPPVTRQTPKTRQVGFEDVSMSEISPDESQASYDSSHSSRSSGDSLDESEGDFVGGGGGMGGGGMDRKRKFGTIGGEYTTVAPTNKYSESLLTYFISTEENYIPPLLTQPPPDLDVNLVIDDEGHTALHWASAMGRIKIVELLLQMGADVQRVNDQGQTALMKAIMFTNNFDKKTFPDLVELLRSSVLTIDRYGQTVFHHISLTTTSRSSLPAARHYIEVLCQRLLADNSPVDVARILNVQDQEGDTALTIAARHVARRCVRVLRRMGADPSIVNKHGTSAYDYIQEHDRQRQRGLFGSSSSMKSPFESNHLDYGQLQTLQASQQLQQQQNQQLPQQLQPSSDLQSIELPRAPKPKAHLSEAATQISQTIFPQMAEHLEALAASYDAELKEKENDIAQAQLLLDSMNTEMSHSGKLLEEMFGEINANAIVQDLVIKGIDQGETSKTQLGLNFISQQLQELGTELRRLVERSQARDLASFVQAEEAKLDHESLNAPSNPKEQEELCHQLTHLQQERRRMVDEVGDLYCNVGVGEKMNDYRRLIAMSCGVKIDQVDGLLDAIAGALTQEITTAAAT